MYPINQCMDPYYPHCRDHRPYPYYPPPAWEADHPPMSMNRQPSYGPLPYSGNTSHSHLHESHSCCNKTYPPGYYSYRPPFPQELPPPHLYYHGPFPHHLNTYPSYFAPPPPYPVDQIPYGYDKFMGHCCGCPNHVFHGGEKSNLKIEEEMPEVKPGSEQKGADNSSVIGRSSCQYPAMCLPSGNVNDNVKGRSFEVPPQLLSKWFPEGGEWTGDGKQQSHDNHYARQFQWPVIWTPRGYDDPKQEKKEFKEVDQNLTVTKEAPHSSDVKIIPLSWFENDHNDQKPVARGGSGEQNGRSSATNQSAGAGFEHRDDKTVDRNFKTIPVVPGELKNENKAAEKKCKTISVVPDKEADENKVHTCRTIPVMVEKKNDEKAGENRKSNNVETSKAKLSKLPPVCLRVDPLPRKKSGNRSSGSLNQATKKVCEKENDKKEAQSKKQETKLLEPNKESQNKGSNLMVKEKSSELDKRIGPRNVIVQDASVKPVQVEEISTKVDQKVQPSISVEAQENASAGSLQECNKRTEADEMKFQGEASKSAREIYLSEPDAAVRIQSAYRGYDVRRWQPLEKLRKVNKVHDQMQDLKKQLQGFEASSKQLTVKEHVAMNETIMTLLLNLDSIQGLHPSVREARKSVARELVCLQEKLDSLCKQLPSEPNRLRSEKEESDRSDNAIQTIAHVSTAEASEEEKFAKAGEEPRTSSINSSEMTNDEDSCGTPKELRQDAGSTEQKHETKESSTTHDEAKAVSLGEYQGTSSMDVPCDAALLGHSTEQKHHMEESNTMSSVESSKKEEATAKGEGREVPSVDCVQSWHDESLPEESSTPEQFSASTEHDSCTQEFSSGGSSPGATDDGTAPMATLSTQRGASVDKDGAAEGQVWQSAASECAELKPDAAAAAGTEDDQYNETSVKLAQPRVYLKDSELHEHDLHVASISLGDQPEEARGGSIQNQVRDTMQDSSAKEPDRTPEATVGDGSMEHVSNAVAESSVQSLLPDEMSRSGSALRQSLLQEPEEVKLCEAFYKVDPALVDQPNEACLVNPAVGPSTGEEKDEAVSSENTRHVASVPSNMCTESGTPESVSNESPCDQDGTMSHENATDAKLSLESQSHPQNSGDKTSEETEASEPVECSDMPEEGSACATEPHRAEAPADDSKEVSATHGAANNDDNKNLADENLKLKEMLQKLLSSGSDQMGVITELSEKVKTLERKLARKRRPKVMVYRPARKAMANLH